VAILAILVALYVLFGAAYYAYRRGVFGDAGLIAISLSLVAAIGAFGWFYLVPMRTIASSPRIRENADLAPARASAPKIAVSDSISVK